MFIQKSVFFVLPSGPAVHSRNLTFVYNIFRGPIGKRIRDGGLPPKGFFQDSFDIGKIFSAFRRILAFSQLVHDMM